MRLAIPTLLALLFAGEPALAQHKLRDAFEGANRGPEAAKGAVVWNHGKAVDIDRSTGPVAPWAADLRNAGWDVLRFDRPLSYDNLNDSPRELESAVDELKRRGYRRIVLAGQSYGAWISFIVGGRRGDIHAIVATAPAAFGTWSSLQGSISWERNASDLYANLDRLRPTRVMLFFFDKDDYDPGGRGAKTEAILAARMPALVIDRPPDLIGHGAAGTVRFARMFGVCIAAWIEPDAPSGQAACDTSAARRPSGEIVLPKEFRPARPDGALKDRHAELAGRWWGWLENGREVEVAFDRIDGRGAGFFYGVGRGATEKPTTTHRDAQWDGDAAVSAIAGKPTISVHPRSPEEAEVRWIAADGKSTLRAIVQRLR